MRLVFLSSPDSTAWCSEIGSLTSLDACDSGASSDVRAPISLHQAVLRKPIFPQGGKGLK